MWEGDLDTFESLVDIDSFIDYVLLNELCSNSDAVWKSIYVSKKVGEKMTFGPVWDFDGAFGSWTGNPDNSQVNYSKAFSTIYLGNCQFVQKYFASANETRYEKFASRYLSLSDKIEEFYFDLVKYKENLKKEGVYNQELWYEVENIFEKNYDANLLFFINHHTYLRNLFSKDYANFMSIVY